jgi:hypothetical protein
MLRRILLLCMLTSMVAFSSGEARASEPVTNAVTAIWYVQQIEMRYVGGTTIYSCGGLRDRVRAIMLRLGAREDVAVVVADCESPGLMPRVRIALTSAVPATSAIVERLTQYDERTQLIARVRGETLPGAADLERFPAVIERISFSRDPRLALRPSDCDLVRQIRREVVPRMAVRVVTDNLNCSAFGNVGRPRLTVDALVAAR